MTGRPMHLLKAHIGISTLGIKSDLMDMIVDVHLGMLVSRSRTSGGRSDDVTRHQ